MMMNQILTWIIHGPRLLQMRAVRNEAVVLHCECLATKQMQENRLSHIPGKKEVNIIAIIL